MKDYYQILGIKRSATDDEIKAAYRALAKKHHPDVSGRQNDETFKQIHEAYSTLIDPQKRTDYDRSLGVEIKVRIRRQNVSRARGGLNRPEPLVPRAENTIRFRSSYRDEEWDFFERLRREILRRFFFGDDF